MVARRRCEGDLFSEVLCCDCCDLRDGLVIVMGMNSLTGVSGAFCRCGLHRRREVDGVGNMRSRILEPADCARVGLGWQGRNGMRFDSGREVLVMQMYGDVFEQRPVGRWKVLWVYFYVDVGAQTSVRHEPSLGPCRVQVRTD